MACPSRLSRIIHRVVLLHLGAVPLLACGSSSSGGPSGPPAPPTCTVTSYTSLSGSPCIDDFPFDGTEAACGAPGVQLPSCQSLCTNGEADSGSIAACSLEQHALPDGGSVSVLECDHVATGICGTGRRTSGSRGFPVPRQGSEAGRLLASMAHLEAVSVHAFERLERELVAHGAPRRLVEGARRARRDEVRHARMMGELADRRGAKATPPPTRRLPVRSLEAIARENAVEGCVRETYGAALAAYQAQAATDPEVRLALEVIARDELRHGELAWSVARWSESRLDERARRRVTSARRRAASRLATEVSREHHPEVARRLGLPPAGAAASIARDVMRALVLRA